MFGKTFRYGRFLMAAGVFGLAGCASEEADDQVESAAATDDEASATVGQMEAPHGQVSVVMYECEEGNGFSLTVAQGVGQAALRVEDGVFQLDQQEVASGMEFSDGTYTFRGQGPEAYVEKDGERIYKDCMAAGHPAAVE